MITKNHSHVTSTIIQTPLRAMIAVGDEQALYLLQFVDDNNSHKTLGKLEQILKKAIKSGSTPVLAMITDELHAYFAGSLRFFKTPIAMVGTAFQQATWQALQQIPFGTTASYATLAHSIGKPTGYRAVARANSTNLLPIIIPCHRIINSNGDLGGYNGGLERKQWLLNHEKNLSLLA